MDPSPIFGDDVAKGIKKKINKAVINVTEEIEARRDQSSMYSRGLSGEGYLGGYRDALFDVLLALNGHEPNGKVPWS